MISINNLSYYLGSRALFENASLHIKPKDKIGLIGLNGTGKSTLLKLIIGQLQKDSGDISMSKDCSIGFLNQDLLSFQSDDSILSVAMEAFSDVTKIQHRIDKILHKMETDYEDKLVEKLARLQEEFEAKDGYVLQSKAEEVLEGIGFRTEDLQRPLREFSGGWRMRVILAKLLLEKPSILMLDEPTNHLDLPSIQWIENYLKSYEGAVIVVSHDRQFLNNTINKIVEVSGQTLTPYPGNYDNYLEEKELRNELQKNAFENQQAKIRQTERFVERFRAKATKARQVQSRVKALERMDKIDDVIEENAAVNFKFNFSKQSGRHVATLDQVSKSYPDIDILKKASGQIERGDKIALIGANGKGKSTLLRIIDGDENVEGKASMGFNVNPSFFAQHQLESLNVENEILEELKQFGSGKSEQELRGVLGCFLFSDEDVFKKIKVLSGGEKSRVALAKTLISEANFLLLDEPTNHLDIQSVNILIQALQQYQGSFILVSHDRYFVTQVANKIWWIEDQQIKEYPGTYEEYTYWCEKNNKPKDAFKPTVVKEEKPKKEKKQKEIDEDLKELTKLKKELTKVESDLEKLEAKKTELEAEMADPTNFNDAEKLDKLNQTYESNSQTLANKDQEWETIAEKIEELEG
ncbi:ABC-F family ATP-binding cassette domain-containing protein [Reichenbachiella carrageenanivorans]|uniref:ABC-F family ATP-binding cassette domain-containing protein n=1 Tax=Reichenbachiella carrageenanivorans TaxID=2979869 RepID=A0ABY6D073_9BACT|nr:ABC-F family ATP-binding cassette domain-containing protein [Reichenbachiella carrageenanivorans]UXX78463.1 ABC-F family ATP-binding cassette domain-containing protein [Reichenbachiella carrageenanivorans]